MEFGRSQRSRQSRIRVSVSHHHIGAKVQQNSFDSFKHAAGLFAVTSRAHLKVEFGRSQV